MSENIAQPGPKELPSIEITLPSGKIIKLLMVITRKAAKSYQTALKSDTSKRDAFAHMIHSLIKGDDIPELAEILNLDDDFLIIIGKETC